MDDVTQRGQVKFLIHQILLVAITDSKCIHDIFYILHYDLCKVLSLQIVYISETAQNISHRIYPTLSVYESGGKVLSKLEPSLESSKGPAQYIYSTIYFV